LTVQRSANSDNLYFDGPFLVRNENTYAIAMLGGVYRLFVPKALLADFDWKEVLSNIKKPLPSTLKTWKEKGKGSGCIWGVLKPNDSSSPENSYMSALKDASERDPSQHIRGHANEELLKIEAKSKGLAMKDQSIVCK
jgi:hypothetical protein